jgi:methyl-accepting chemotaxis protein
MIRNSLLAKQFIIIGVVLGLMALVIGLGCYGISRLQKSLTAFSTWADIDMVMNEDVTQNVLGVINSVAAYAKAPTDDQYGNFLAAKTAAEKGLEEWREMVRAYPRLTASADQVKPLLTDIGQNMEEYRGLIQSKVAAVIDSDRLIGEAAETLEQVMENVIDPEKARHEEAKDIENMVKWGEIDMVMNEGVIAPVLKLQTAIHDVAADMADKKFMSLQGRLEDAREGLKEWGELVKGRVKLEETVKTIEASLASIAGHAEDLKRMSERESNIATKIAQDAETSAAVLEKAMEEIIDPAKEKVVREAEDIKINTTLILLVVGIVSFAFSLLLTTLNSLSISRAVKRAVFLAEDVRKGDHLQRLVLNRSDELGMLADALNAMADTLEKKAGLATTIASGDLTPTVALASDKDELGKALRNMVRSLNETLGQIQEAAGQVSSGSAQVADSSQALSQGATEQAASLEEITSSMTEVGSQTKANAENASQANQLSLGVRDSAEEGNSRMHEMIAAMNDIRNSSREIAKIIKTIDDIAFQTNLLALNAAVEAARAGKHGKGFAVVAQEVRNLASRSAKAASETAELIEGAVRNVEKGDGIVNRTAESLEDIVTGVTKVADLVSEIAAASNEQALGISQITEGLGQVDQVTQQNTANAEESASAAEELASMASQLQHVTGRFRLNHAALAAPRAKAAPVLENEDWGESPAIQDREDGIVAPADVIPLDDDEFGKY